MMKMEILNKNDYSRMEKLNIKGLKVDIKTNRAYRVITLHVIYTCIYKLET